MAIVTVGLNAPTQDDIDSFKAAFQITDTGGGTGEDGKSAYEIAVDNGFVGTEAQWLNSLHGSDGAPGPTGPQGIQGEPGPSGPAGANGIDGTIGAPGPQGVAGPSAYQIAVSNGFVGNEQDWLNSLWGPQGIQGPVGPQGEAGPQGIQGLPGAQGPKGDKGDKGDTGAQGIPGNTGPQGATGLQGLPGLNGSQGPQGPQGIQGVQGPMGPQGPAGMNGEDGTDATVTYQAVINALGYTPGTGDGTGNANTADITTAINSHIAAAYPHGLTYPLTPGGYAVVITGIDLNTAYRTGFFRGESLVHAPLDNGGWWHVLIASYNADWIKQTATAFGSGNTAGEIYERVCVGGVWTSWAKVYKEGDAIGATAPNSGAFTSLSTTQGATFGGNVGVGTGSPLYKLVVSDSGNSGIEFGPGYSGNSNLIQSYNRSAGIYTNTVYDAASHVFNIAGSQKAVLDASGNLSVVGSIYSQAWIGTAGDFTSSGGAMALRNIAIENHAHAYNSGLVFNYVGYGQGVSYYRNLDIYNGKMGLIARFDAINNALYVANMLSVGADDAAGRRVRIIGDHPSTTFQLYSIGNGAGADASVDIWASEPEQTFRGAGIGSNVNKHPYYGPRDTGFYGSYIRFRDDGFISVGKSLPGDTSFTDRGLISPYGLLLAETAGLSMGGASIHFNQSGVRSWQLKAQYGGMQLLSGDEGGGFYPGSDVGMDLGGHATRWRDAHIGRFIQVGSGGLEGQFPAYNVLGDGVGYHGDLSLTVAGGAAYFRKSGTCNGSSTAALSLGHHSGSGRSLDATGTINASGADYAEHEYNNGHTVVKGQIIGFDADGLLTPYFSEAIRFAIKSTEPGYTGGNTWMANLPPRPSKPVLHDVQRRSYGEADEVNPDAEVDALIEQEYQDALLAAEIDYQAASLQYERDLSLFNAAVKDAADKVDRIAYCGKVPVNYTGATPGDYLIVKKGDNDSITCYSTRVPTHEQYLLCIGRVNKILPDGRAEVAVIIH